MKICVVTQYFYPEEFKINDLVREFIRRGHEVCVLTGKPNYPKGDYFPGYSFPKTVYEDFFGAKVIRVPLIRRGRGGALRLIVNYLSFVFFADWYLLTHKIQADAVFCFGTSPILQALPGIKLKRKNNCKVSFWYQDLWPESVFATTHIKNNLLYTVINWVVKYIYKNTDNIMVTSPAFESSIVEKGDFASKVKFIPQWAEDIFLDRSRISEAKYKDWIPDGFIVMYAGNIGAAQDLPSVLEAANILKNAPDIHFVIIGDGREREHAEKIVEKYSLQETVHFLGRHPFSEMPDFYVHADAMLVSLRDDDIFSLTIPARIQSYMAFGKPIVTMLSGIGSRIVEEAGCGLTAEAGDYKKLADNILELSRSDKHLMEEMGGKAHEYYMAHFDKSGIVEKIISEL